MNEIIKDYRKNFLFSTIFSFFWAGLIVAGLFMAKSFEKIPAVAVPVSILAAVWAIWQIGEYLLAPVFFKNNIKKLPEKDAKAIRETIPNTVGNGRYFFDDHAVYFYGKLIKTVRFSDIKSIEPKGFKLLLVLENGKKAAFPLDPDENSAMLAAALKSKIPDLTIILGGKVMTTPPINNDK